MSGFERRRDSNLRGNKEVMRERDSNEMGRFGRALCWVLWVYSTAKKKQERMGVREGDKTVKEIGGKKHKMQHMGKLNLCASKSYLLYILSFLIQFNLNPLLISSFHLFLIGP